MITLLSYYILSLDKKKLSELDWTLIYTHSYPMHFILHFFYTKWNLCIEIKDDMTRVSGYDLKGRTKQKHKNNLLNHGPAMMVRISGLQQHTPFRRPPPLFGHAPFSLCAPPPSPSPPPRPELHACQCIIWVRNRFQTSVRLSLSLSRSRSLSLSRSLFTQLDLGTHQEHISTDASERTVNNLFQKNK